MKKISILGSTGSIGTQALDVISRNPGLAINYLTANGNIDLLEKQIESFNPRGVVISNEDSYKTFKKNSRFKGEILFGREGLIEAAVADDNDIILSSLVGFAGVEPTLAAVKKGKLIALANKETLVSAGSIIMSEAKNNNAEILAVDSEHSAVLQCLAGEKNEQIEKVILTASGGPFRKIDKSEFKNITVEQALDHPNWSMGNKITIDSATLMNKGFELIEAYWLFDTGLDRLDVLVHPQSIVHSMVVFRDGSVKAQLGMPDMRVPIAYAINYPDHLDYDFPRLDLSLTTDLSFEKPDYEKFPCLSFAFKALDRGGNIPAALNAANEVAVAAFLNREIRFNDIPEIINSTTEKISFINNPSIEDILETDSFAREIADDLRSVI